jgi:uncharacterized protein (DUF849 family)
LKAGAAAVHLHVRNATEHPSSPGADFESGKESLDPTDVARTLLAVRAAAPKASIGISTGAWILPDPDARHQAVEAWQVLPGFASVNFGEVGSVELARLLLSRGVEVEVGLCDPAAAEVFVNSGLVTKCFRVLLEPQEQTMNQALETVGGIERVLNSAVLQLPPLLLHGTEATVWPMIDEAIARGYDSRVGLEDTLVLADGSLARDNVELIIEAVRRGQAAGER